MKTRAASLIGSALFLMLAPGTLAGLIPWWITGWRKGAPPFGLEALSWVGLALIAAGALVLLESFVRFAWVGLGTPAPVAPPTNLVVTGLYRHVRNPMYVALEALILGQALVFASALLAAYGAAAGLMFHLFVTGYEEPKLLRTFGPDYAAYCRNVPRWRVGLKAWRP